MHPCLRLVILTHGVPIVTWRVIAFSKPTRDSSLLSEGFLLCCLNFLRVSLRQSWPSNLVRERTIVLLLCEPRIPCQMLDHGGNNMYLLSNIVPLLSTGTFLTLSSQRRLSFLFDSWLLLLSPLFISDSEVSTSLRLINMKSHRCLQSWITRLPIVSKSLLVTQSQCSLKLNRILQFLTWKILPRPFL